MKKVWLLKFPLHAHYVESSDEIKALAVKAGLEIIDAKYAEGFDKSKVADMSEEPALTAIGSEPKEPKEPKEEPKEEHKEGNEERELRDEYERLYGKKAGGRMSLETLRQKVKEASK